MAQKRKRPASKSKGESRAKPKPKTKARPRPKTKPKARAKRKAKSRRKFALPKFSVSIGHLFYLYLALLPVLAIGALNFDKEIWSRYLEFISVETPPDAAPEIHWFYHVFCVLAFFVSAVFSLLIIRTTPRPKSNLLALFLIFDAPVFFAIAHAYGGRISAGQMFIGGFVMESIAFAIAVSAARVVTKKKLAFFVAAAMAVVFSFYGVETGRALLQSGWKSQLIAAAALATTVAGFHWLLKTKNTGDCAPLQIVMSNFAIVVMFATWCLAAVVLFAAV